MVLFDWSRMLWKKKIDYADYFVAPPKKRWPVKDEMSDRIYDPRFLYNNIWREQKITVDPPRNFIKDPFAQGSLLEYGYLVYFRGDTGYEGLCEHLSSIGFTSHVLTQYLPVWNESANVWEDGYINHLRVIKLPWLAATFDVPENNLRRFPKQNQLLSLLADFLDRERRFLREFPVKTYPEAEWASGLGEVWKPGFNFCLVRNGPFLDFFSRPVLVPRLKS